VSSVNVFQDHEGITLQDRSLKEKEKNGKKNRERERERERE